MKGGGEGGEGEGGGGGVWQPVRRVNGYRVYGGKEKEGEGLSLGAAIWLQATRNQKSRARAEKKG